MKYLIPIVYAFTLWVAIATAQETRSTLTGLVTDTTGAIVPHANITVRNQDTGALSTVQSNGVGAYTIPFIMPGIYEVRVEITGFKTYVHSGLELRTGQILKENIALTVGEVSEAVTVYGGTPLIDTSTASLSDQLQGEELQDLPSNGRSPLGFAHMEFGVISKDKHAVGVTEPFNGQTTYDFSVGGGFAASNELMLNGAPDMSDSSRNYGFSPELDAVDTVKVDIFSSNAALGDTSGGFVNITTKSGTNQYHGTASEYYEGSRPLTAVAHYVATPAASTHYHQYGGTFGGPVRLPHLYNGHDKLFFFYSLEGFWANGSTSTLTAVPTAAERNGDFSALLNDSGGQLYNPYGGSEDSSGNITRSAISGNKFSNSSLSVDSIAQKYLNMIPLPNYSGSTTTADGENNYNANAPETNRYLSNQLRVDYNLSTKNKIFVDLHHSRDTINYDNYFHDALTGTSEQYLNEGLQLDDVHTINSSTSVEGRIAFSRNGTHNEPTSLGISSETMGFPSYLQANSQITAIPEVYFKDSTDKLYLSQMTADVSGYQYYDSLQFYAILNKTWRDHSFKVGVDIRTAKNSTTNAPLDQATAAGAFVFQSSKGGFMTQSPNVATKETQQPFGASFALFELGLPTDGSIAYDKDFQFDNWYFAGFAQDDWKIKPNLTLSLGVRLEHPTAFVESNNDMSTTWVPDKPNYVTNQAIAKYAAAPSSYLSLSSFNPTGNMLFASTSGSRSPFSTAPIYPSPRVSFAWSPDFGHGKLSIRGGGGIYVNPIGDWSNSQGLYTGIWYGYTQSSSMVYSLDDNLTPDTTWDNPFPTDSSKANYNPILTPPGATCANYCGVNTKLGSDINFAAPFKGPYLEKWDLDIEKQFGNNWLIEIGYLGSHGIHNLGSKDLSQAAYLPYLVHSQYGNDAAISAITKTMSSTLANPFQGTMPSEVNSNGVTVTNTHNLNTKATITLSNLLHNYPEYEDLVEQGIPEQSTKFEGLLFQISKRMTNGFEFHFNYEHSRLLGYLNRLNVGDKLSYGETTSDYPDHATFIGMYKLPFGRGEKFFSDTRLGNAIGGWEITGIYQFLSGAPVSWGNVIYNGNWHDFKNQPHNWTGKAFNTSVFDTTSADQPGSWNYRTFPGYVLRADHTNNFDFSILKNFYIHNHIQIQPRVDAFNAMNHPQFDSPNVSPTNSNFGKISSQSNSARQLQGGMHIRF